MRTGHEVYLAGRDHHSRQRLALVGRARRARSRPASSSSTTSRRPSCATGRVRGVEALVRWEHPERGLLGPSHFLPLVEQSGLTRALTAFVLDRALEEIGRAATARPELSVAVNLGPADLLDLGLPSEVERLLDHTLRRPTARDRGLGGHRDGRRRAHRRRARRAARDRRPHRARRLRRRPRRARAPQGAARRRAQDRPLVRDARGRRRARRRDRALADGSRPPARACASSPRASTARRPASCSA